SNPTPYRPRRGRTFSLSDDGKPHSTPLGLVEHRGSSFPWVSPTANDIGPLRGPPLWIAAARRRLCPRPRRYFQAASSRRSPRRFAHFHVQWRAAGSWESVVSLFYAARKKARDYEYKENAAAPSGP